MSNIILSLRDIHKSYRQGDKTLQVLGGISLEIHTGEMVALVGPSGCGKSTLLHIAGLLDTPDKGEVIVEGKSVGNLNDRERTAIRRNTIGFVYQFHHLLPEFSALENVVLPQMIAATSKMEASETASKLLGHLGLSARLNHRPAELSGGEQQRVAIARALANQPKILLADEPTGNLDPHTAGDVFKALQHMAKTLSMAMLLVTHNHELAKKADRIIALN